MSTFTRSPRRRISYRAQRSALSSKLGDAHSARLRIFRKSAAPALSLLLLVLSLGLGCQPGCQDPVGCEVEACATASIPIEGKTLGTAEPPNIGFNDNEK